jgi:hypothetical protein
MEVPGVVRVRSTVSLPGLPVGARTLADPDARYVREALDAGFLVLEEAPGDDDQEAAVAAGG